MGEIPLAQVEKILKKQTGMRINVDAVKELAEYLEDLTMEIGSTAVDLAATAKRKTINVDDIKLAVKRI